MHVHGSEIDCTRETDTELRAEARWQGSVGYEATRVDRRGL